MKLQTITKRLAAFATMALLCFTLPNRGSAQDGYGINIQYAGGGYCSSQTHSTSGTIKIPCNPDSASVGYSATLNLLNSDGVTHLIFTLQFTNDSSFPINLVAYAMTNFDRPEMDSKPHVVAGGDTGLAPI